MERDFMKLKDRKEKSKKQLEKLFHKLIIASKNDMDKFEEQEMKKLRPFIRNWFDQLIKPNFMRKKPKVIRDKLKDKIIRDFRTLFEQEDDDCYEPKRISSFQNNNQIEYESNGKKNRDLSLDEYLNNIKP